MAQTITKKSDRETKTCRIFKRKREKQKTEKRKKGEKQKMKRIITIQDLSCIGKCSLTVALPVISAMGIETAVIPTALLSNHTAFSDFTFLDLKDEIIPITNQFKKENISFDAIYTGYLGSESQIDIVSDFIDEMRNKNTLVIVDPAMADFGRLYAGFDEKFAKKMSGLVKKADVVLPNITESAILLGEKYLDYTDSAYNEDYIKRMLKGLCEFGVREAVITGVVSTDGKKIGAMGYNSENKEFYSYYHEKIDRIFHGTGDVFASCYSGCAVNGFSTQKSVKTALDFTYKAIEETLEDVNAVWYGVNFEKALPYLIDITKTKGE